MEFARSKDGTLIAYSVSGRGAPLVLVHGTGDSHFRWASVSAALGESFRLHTMDRRGRGQSGDSPCYELEREFEDVLAVIEAAGAPVYLLGHSFGGICALEAAARTDRVKKMILYEPPITVVGEEMYDSKFLARVEELLSMGDLQGIWVSFLKEVIRMSDGEIERSKASPSWKARVAISGVLPREARERSTYRFDPARFAGFRVPTLLLTGSESPPPLRAAVGMLHENLHYSRVAVLDGQRHSAMSGAPDAFLREVLGFLRD